MLYCCGVELCILGYGRIYGVNQSQNRAKWTVSGTIDDEIIQMT